MNIKNLRITYIRQRLITFQREPGTRGCWDKGLPWQIPHRTATVLTMCSLSGHNNNCYSRWHGRWPNAGLMLGQRRKRWTNNKQTSGQRLVLAENGVLSQMYKTVSLPPNTRHSPNAVSLLGKRRRRWTSSNPPLGEGLVFAGRGCRFNTYDAQLLLAIFHSFEAGIANAISRSK